MNLPLVSYQASDIYARVVKVVSKDDRLQHGLEFTSVVSETNGKIQLLVQMLIHSADSEQGEFIGRRR